MAALDWTEVLVLSPLGWHELVAEALALSPQASVAFGRPSLESGEPPPGFDYVRAFYRGEEDGAELRARIRAALAALPERTGASELRGLEPRFRTFAGQDWLHTWRKDWKPMRVGRLAIVPPDWRGPARGGDVQLVLEPGGAFGTGRHATTRAALRALQSRLAPGQRVLDAGTGSGILAVAALRFGASFALGFDVDPHALPHARALAEANGVERSCELRLGGFECLGEHEPRFDGALANLYADLIQTHARDLAASLVPGGWFVASGCSRGKREPTLAALAGAGLRVERVASRGRWDTFEGVRDVSPSRFCL